MFHFIDLGNKKKADRINILNSIAQKKEEIQKQQEQVSEDLASNNKVSKVAETVATKESIDDLIYKPKFEDFLMSPLKDRSVVKYTLEESTNPHYRLYQIVSSTKKCYGYSNMPYFLSSTSLLVQKSDLNSYKNSKMPSAKPQPQSSSKPTSTPVPTQPPKPKSFFAKLALLKSKQQ